MNIPDGSVKSQKRRCSVILAKAGFGIIRCFGAPAFAGVTEIMTFYGTIIFSDHDD